MTHNEMKKIIKSYVDICTDSQIEFLYNLLSGQIHKFINSLENDHKPFDYGRPISWDNKARDIGIEPNGYIWSYRDHSLSGRPVNVPKLAIDKIIELF